MTRRRSALAGLVIVGVAGLGAAGWATASMGGQAADVAGASGASPTPEAPATAAVERQTLTVTDERDGTLGHVGEARAVGQLAGTLTWLPEIGTVVARNDAVAEVDGSTRAVLLYGDRPAWRTLRKGVSRGRDVRQLEENLHALGHLRKAEVDTAWDDDTTNAVKRWQKARRLEVDGVVDLGEVVFLSAALRVTDRVAEVGGPIGPGSVLVAGTSTTLAVTVELDPADAGLLAEGTEVEIELPDGATTPGTVTDVGTVASASSDGTGGGEGGSDPTIEVTIGVDDPAALGSLEAGPVTVRVVVARREGVLTVPVEALLALREGGYAVEAVDGAERRLVEVELGLFDDGVVEVRGSGIDAGTKVVVPR